MNAGPPDPPDDNAGHSGEGSQQPAPPPPPPGATAGGPPHGADGSAPAEADESPKRRRGLIIGVLAAAMLLLIPGGVFAWRALDGGGPQPHDVLPADSIGYVRVDMDPSASQKVDAFRFLDKFPSFGEVTGISDEDEDLRERLFTEFADATNCDLDFESDVEPWIGNRVGASVMPSSDDGEPRLVVALQVDDEDAARDTINAAFDCGPGADEVGMSFANGYVLFTDTQDNADNYADAAEDSSLGDNDEFVEAMDQLGEPGIASFWVSGTGIYDAFNDMGGAMDEGTMPDGPSTTDEAGTMDYEPTMPDDPGTELDDPTMPDDPGDILSEDMIEDSYRSAAGAFRFDDSHAEIASVTMGDVYEDIDSDGVRADVPEDTALLLGASGFNDTLTDNWDSLADSYPDLAAEIDAFAEQTGLSLPDDLATALGDNLVAAVDGNDLDLPSMIQSDDLSSLKAGVKVDTDTEAFGDLRSKLDDLAASEGQSLDALPLEETDDGYVLASSDDYASILTDGGGLGDSDIYTNAVADADNADAVFFLNSDVVEDDLADLLESQGADESAVDSVRALQAIGLSASSGDGYTEMSLRITAD